MSVSLNVQELDTGKVTTIKDSGERRQFETGAVRDIQDGKGRCDLMPLMVVANLMHPDCDKVLEDIALFMETNDTNYLYEAIIIFSKMEYKTVPNMLLEVSRHFEEGAKKYGENNWQKGIPIKCYIDSAVRHYLKYRRLDSDEPHDRAFLWNLMCCIWENDFHEKEVKE